MLPYNVFMFKKPIDINSLKPWQKLTYFLCLLAWYIFAGIFFMWQSGKIDELPQTALILFFAALPGIIALIAIYFASKDKSASQKAFKHK